MRNATNVLMISVDQLGRNHISSGGDQTSRMPTLGFLENSGISFDNCYSECPVCIPARRSLMTGLSTKTHGDRVYSDRMKMPDVTTLAQAFRDNGYQAFSVGKLHVYPQRDRIGFDDSWILEEGRYEFGEVDDYQQWLAEQGFIGDEFMHGMGNNVYYTRPWHLPEYTHPTNWITKRMCEIIKRRDPLRPALFYVSYQFPHPPLVPLSCYLDEYKNISLPQTRRGDWLDQTEIVKMLSAQSSRYTEQEKDLARKAYYAQCTHIDHQLRLIMGTLRECGLSDNTLIIFFSDHGDMLFDHGMVAKRCFYEASANIPMVLSGRPIENIISVHGERVDHRLCCLQDVMPTLLELCGLTVPDTVEGISMTSSKQREFLYGEVGEGRKATRMIRDERYKLIYYPYGNVIQLFDLDKDRDERHDFAGDVEYHAIKQRLTAELIRHLYGNDIKWIEGDELIGEDFGVDHKCEDYGLYNQRGFHWPPPVVGYNSVGKNA